MEESETVIEENEYDNFATKIFSFYEKEETQTIDREALNAIFCKDF